MSVRQGPGDTELSDALEAASADLVAIRAALASGTGESIDLARQYWRNHGPTLRTVLMLLLHQVRRDLLVQLYAMRRQLAEQLPPRQSRDADAGDADLD